MLGAWQRFFLPCVLLGGSWVVISGVISRVTLLITHVRGLITPLITTHEPPSKSHDHPRNPEGIPPFLFC